MSEPGRDKWKMVLFEYIANLDEGENENENEVPDLVPMIRDPRVNHQARRMVDWFKREMEARQLTPEKEAALLNGVRRDGWIDNEHRRRCDCKRNRCKVFLRIDPGLRKKARTDHERPEHKQDRVAVRRRLCRVGGSDIARGTCDVLDIELLTEVLAEPWRDLPRQDVHAAPRRKRHDDAHGSRRVSRLCA